MIGDFAPPDSDNPVDWALAYVAADMSVFPVGANKRPLVPQGLHAASTAEAVIRSWWASWPHADIGWAVPANVVVLDLDVGKIGNGLKDFIAHEGRQPDDVPTPQASTPSGGRHLVYAANGAAYRNNVRVNGATIDLRTAGGYVVLPAGSNGRAWLKPLATPLAQAPKWIPPASSAEVKARPFSGEVTAYARAALEKACLAIEKAPSGAQEATLNKECFSIGGLIGAGELDRETAIAALITAADLMPTYSGPWRDLERKVSRSVDDGMRRPRTRASRPPAGGNDVYHTGADINIRPAGPQDELVLVSGAKKRITTLERLNERFALLEAPGSPSVYISRKDLLPIQDTDLKRRLAGEVVKKPGGPKIGYQSAYSFWTGHAQRHVYRSIVFTGRNDLPPDAYNLFRGLGVTPREGRCGLILSHIEEVICSGDRVAFEAMINLMAWQIQNIGKPSRVIVMLKTQGHQAGKGILLGETLLPIYGPSGFAPGAADKVIGKFNDTVRGVSFIFLDEVLFAGDKRAADSIKRLSTATSESIEGKGVPVIMCPVGVNLYLATNHENAAFIEEGDARYWALIVSEHRIGDTAYFAALMHEIETGGREAFAHYLLNLDVSGFVPLRDVPKDNSAKRDLIRLSINPFDARKWIEDCCETGCLADTDEAGHAFQ